MITALVCVYVFLARYACDIFVVHACMRACVCVCVCVCLSSGLMPLNVFDVSFKMRMHIEYININIRIHRYIHKFTHTYIHTYTCPCQASNCQESFSSFKFIHSISMHAFVHVCVCVFRSFIYMFVYIHAYVWMCSYVCMCSFVCRPRLYRATCSTS
jgi:hypothetical protein